MYKVDINSKTGYTFDVCSKDSQFVVALDGKGMTPPDTLLASIGSCIGVYIRKYADGAKLDLGEFGISVSADLGREAPYYFRTINVVIDIKGAVLDERRRKALSEFVKNCPVHNTLKNDPNVTIAFS